MLLDFKDCSLLPFLFSENPQYLNISGAEQTELIAKIKLQFVLSFVYNKYS